MLLIAGLWLFNRTHYENWGIVCLLLGAGYLEMAGYITVLLDGLLFRGWLL